jgi:hypothetical protein
MEIRLRMQIIHAFIQIWKDSRDKTSKIEETLKGSFRLFSEAGKQTIVIGSEGIVAFDKLMSLLTEVSTIREKFSRKELERRIQSTVIDLFSIEPSEIETRVNSYVDRMLQEFERAIPTKWNVYLPVENLIVHFELNIGRALIKMFDESIEKSILENFITINQLSTSPPDVKAEMERIFRERLSQDFTGRAIIIVETRAFDDTRAIESAIEQAETVLNVLRFYSRGVIVNNARSYRMYIGLKGSIYKGQLFAVAFCGVERFNTTFENTGYLYPLELGQKELSRMEEDSFMILHKILLKEPKQRTAFENLIVNSVNLFGRAMNNQDTTSAFVSMVVALESILLKKAEPIKTLLAERTALLLGRVYEERMFYFRHMSQLYQIRSDIVHRGFLDVTEGDLALLSLIVYRVLVRLIADSPKLNDIGELVKTFDKLKFGYAKENV